MLKILINVFNGKFCLVDVLFEIDKSYIYQIYQQNWEAS